MHTTYATDSQTRAEEVTNRDSRPVFGNESLASIYRSPLSRGEA
jgi:hypothetical protein